MDPALLQMVQALATQAATQAVNNTIQQMENLQQSQPMAIASSIEPEKFAGGPTQNFQEWVTDFEGGLYSGSKL